MSGDNRSRVAELILSRLAEVVARMERLEQRLVDLADEIDAMDRGRRPYGDGTNPRTGRR